MRKTYLFLLFTLILSGCMPGGEGKISVGLRKKESSTISSASISSVHIVNNQLVINGAGLTGVQSVKVSGNSLNENFTIESHTATKIIANAVQGFSFDVSKAFSLILSDASASATFQIDFSLCNATLGGAGFDCSAPADNDVLTYDQATSKWVPRALTGLSYRGVWDANTTEPVSTLVGQYYIVSVANLPTYKVGDWIVWNGSSYDTISQSSGGGAISTVFGRIGAVVATEGDYNLDKLLDVDLTTPPTTGQVLKYDGAKWVASDEAGGPGGAGSVTTTALADGSVTNVKIADVAASKITGGITSAQITDGTIANADISATAAIAYSKLSIPALSIPYAQLNIADGDIPAAKIAGLPSATAVLTTAITDGDTTHAPDGNVVFDTLATKLDKTGGTITTMLNVPAPVFGTEATTKTYVDNLVAGKEGTLSTGTTAQYFRGDKSLATLNTDAVPEGTNTYFTVARVLSATIAGLSSTAGNVANGDSILTALGKLFRTQGDSVSKSANTTITGQVTIDPTTGVLNVPTPGSATQAVNKGWVENLVDTYGHWIKSTNDISYTAGNVGIGGAASATAATKLKVTGDIETTNMTATGNTITSSVTAQSLYIDGYTGSWAPVTIKNNQTNGYSGIIFADSASTNQAAFGYSNTGSGVLAGTAFITSLLPGTPVTIGIAGVEAVRVAANTGYVGIGANDPNTRLDVNGTIVSRPPSPYASATIDLKVSNTHVLTAIGQSAITLTNMVHGGAYTLIIQDTTSRTYTFTGCATSKFQPANMATIAGTHTIYNIMTVYNGTNYDCYITWSSGYN